MATVICEHCGTSNTRPARFCRNCDSFLDWTGVPTDEAPPAPSPRGPAPGPGESGRAGQDRQGQGRPAPGGPRPPSGPGGDRSNPFRAGRITASGSGERPWPGETTGPGAGPGWGGNEPRTPFRPAEDTPWPRPSVPGEDPGPFPGAGYGDDPAYQQGSGFQQEDGGRRPGTPRAADPATWHGPAADGPWSPAPPGPQPNPRLGWLATGGGRLCPSCGTTSDRERRFCRRCGSWLGGGTAPRLQRRKLPWWRRWWLRWFGRDERVGASRASRAAYRQSLSPVTRFFRWTLGLVALILVVLMLPFTGVHPYTRVHDYLAHLRGWDRVKIPSKNVDNGANQRPIQDGKASYLVDGIRDRGWSTDWTLGSAAGGVPCGMLTPPGPTVTVHFPRAMRIREVGVEAGLAAIDRYRSAQYRPRTIELHWSNNQCTSRQLADTPALQRFDAPEATMTWVIVRVTDAYAPQAKPTNVLTIGEITFWKR